MPTGTASGNEHLFWEGAAQIDAGDRRLEVTCRVLLDDQPQRNLRVDVISGLDFITLFDSRFDLVLTIPGITEPVGLFLKETFTTLNGQDLVRFVVKRSPIWVTRTDQIQSGRALIVNFAQYGFNPTQLMELRGGAWKVLLTPVSDDILVANNVTQNDEYRVTHQIDFSREDASTFSVSEMMIFLDNLQLFLSFCRGRWVALGLVVGFDGSGNIAVEQWGTGRQSSWQEPSGWIDRYYPEPVVTLFSPFIEKLSNELWKQLFSHVVYWFSRAETDTAGVDGACVLLQTTLERFAWQLIVREQKALSEKAFNRLTAADNLRLMLKLLGIPAKIPSGLINLQTYAEPKGQDGPEAFTTIRNSIVHPPRNASNEEKIPYYEAYSLAKWYVELAVLSVCAYKGDYHNRTSSSRWVGQVEKVPWIKEENQSI